MGRYKGRSSVACHACHTQKLKCSGDIPCQRCKNRGRDCTYPAKERLVAVPENYLRTVEREAALARSAALAPPRDILTAGGAAAGAGAGSWPRPDESTTPPQDSTPFASQALEDCGAERFVQKLRELSLSASSESNDLAEPSLHQRGESHNKYTYSRLNFDFHDSELQFRLPPKPYAFHLLQIFEEGYCDYHWHLRKQFAQRLALTYSHPESQSRDRNWLCRVSIVFALGEAWNRGRSFRPGLDELASRSGGAYGVPDPTCLDHVSPQSSADRPLPAGSEYFEQGMALLKAPSEEPTLDDVSALNLVAFYCHSLNRRKTAYFYAGQSIRLATLLCRQEPNSSDNPVLREHKIRTWWTSYCMDLMISTELGLAPVYEGVAKGRPMPSIANLSIDDQDEFGNHDLHESIVKGYQIKTKVVETVARLRGTQPRLKDLKPCLNLLKGWRDNLPKSMSFDFENGFPQEIWRFPWARVLTSMYLRYHQCYILLLRPVFLQELSNIIHARKGGAGDSKPAVSTPGTDPGEMEPLEQQCLHAARNNCVILTNLWTASKIAKYGYWESLHLFSGLAILSLSRLLDLPARDMTPDNPLTQWSSNTSARSGPSIPPPPGEDAILFSQARALLDEMADAGNPAANDHKILLVDVEEMVDRVLRRKLGGIDDQASFGVGGGDGAAIETTEFQDFTTPLFDGMVNDAQWTGMDWDGWLNGWSGFDTNGLHQ